VKKSKQRKKKEGGKKGARIKSPFKEKKSEGCPPPHCTGELVREESQGKKKRKKKTDIPWVSNVSGKRGAKPDHNGN